MVFLTKVEGGRKFSHRTVNSHSHVSQMCSARPGCSALGQSQPRRRGHHPEHQANSYLHTAFIQTFEHTVFSLNIKHYLFIYFFLISSFTEGKDHLLSAITVSEALSYTVGLIWSQLHLCQFLVKRTAGLQAMRRQSCHWDPTHNLSKLGLQIQASSIGTVVTLHPSPALVSLRNCHIPRYGSWKDED